MVVSIRIFDFCYFCTTFIYVIKNFDFKYKKHSLNFSLLRHSKHVPEFGQTSSRDPGIGSQLHLFTRIYSRHTSSIRHIETYIRHNLCHHFSNYIHLSSDIRHVYSTRTIQFLTN